MDRSTVVTLISVTVSKNSYGVSEKTESCRNVYANVKSISSSEFFEAGQAGMQASYQFVLFGPDYHGEKLVEYNGKRYSVYRTYNRQNDLIELYTEDRAGV